MKKFKKILHTDQKFSCFLRDVSAAKLIGANPGKDSFFARKLHFQYFKRNVMPHTDLITVMPVNNVPFPDYNRVTASIGKYVCF